jgi:hypothetical protein
MFLAEGFINLYSNLLGRINVATILPLIDTSSPSPMPDDVEHEGNEFVLFT